MLIFFNMFKILNFKSSYVVKLNKTYLVNIWFYMDFQ